MDAQLKDVERSKAANDHKPPIDPLRRIFVPIERLKSDGSVVFNTTDKRYYVRAEPGAPMRRMVPKVRGKAARRADKLARRK